jgi:hypothetical protein
MSGGPAVGDNREKSLKKAAKAKVKIRKAEAKARGASGSTRESAGVVLRKREGGSELVISGLTDEQLTRLLPHVHKEVLIAVTEERSVFRARVMRFVREGIFQTVVKVVAGLIVGYLLIRFGLR